MPNIGPMEIAIVLVIVLVIFGPKKLPELGKSMGRGIREFKGSISGDNKDDDENKDESRQLTGGTEEPHAVADTPKQAVGA